MIKFLILLFVVSLLSAQTSMPDSLRFRIAKASRINVPPLIDGKIEADIWGDTDIIDGFFQVNPIQLGNPSEHTSAKIIYDDKYIYVAFICEDKEPEKIKKVLSRRDSYQNGFDSASDWVRVGLDSKNNDQNAILLGVNSAGVKMDVAVEGNNNYDISWNSVWDVAVSSDLNGWYAEYKIPFSMLQFDNQKNMEWGLLLGRHLYKKQEFIEWPGRRLSDRGTARFFGILKGLSNIPNPKQFEIVPYSLLGENDGEFKINIGADIRYGITSNMTAQVTFNPDFGQVESDPSVLNLSAFETELDEKRPFFSEGANFFDNRIQLFNSRRIGKVPNYFVPDDGELSDVPDNTTILGAVKLMGNLSNGINYGLIQALASEEKASWISDLDPLKKIDTIIEPKANYSVARLEIPFLNEVSRIGINATNVSRENAFGATVAGLDWRVGLLNNRLSSSGQIIQSNKENIVGNAHRLNILYTNPSFWGIRAWYGFFDDKFDINDLGFLRRNNISWMGAKLSLRKDDPWGSFINNSLEFRFSKDYRNDGTLLENEFGIESENLLKNYWSFNFAGMIDGLESVYNDNDLFRDDRAWIFKTERFSFLGTGFRTDRRKSFILGFFGGVGSAKIRGKGYRLNVDGEFKPLDNLNIKVSLTQDLSPSLMQWVDIIENQDELFRVYAKTEQLTRNVNIRIDWTVSPDVSFQGFIQPFSARMDYHEFYNLVEQKTMDLASYNYGSDPGFRLMDTIGTFVLRWEYTAGSTIFLVYNLNQNEYFENSLGAWDTDLSNAVYFKVNYWLKN